MYMLDYISNIKQPKNKTINCISEFGVAKRFCPPHIGLKC